MISYFHLLQERIEMESKEQIQAKVIELVATQANGVSPEQIRPETHFINDLSFDSLELVELTMAVEDAFDITVAEEDAHSYMTVDALTNGIIEHLSRAIAS